MNGSIKAAPPALPAVVANLYAELLDLTETDATLGYVEGSYNRKVIGHAAHWYRQRSIGKRRVQTYIGPESPALLAEIERTRKEHDLTRREFRRRREICRALRATLPMTMDLTTGKVLRGLARSGAFAASAVLIGSHAYGIYGPMLGRKLSDQNTRTGDIGIAAVNIGIPDPISFVDVIKAADAEFFEIPPAPGSRLSTKLKLRGSEYRVELLTPGTKDSTRPVPIADLRFAAVPLPYLDYLIEAPVEAVAPVAEGIRVKVPQPARFAIHKLIVAQERAQHAAVKRIKDLAQASELMAALREVRPGAIATAWSDLERRGRSYANPAKRSLQELQSDVDDMRKA